MSDEQKAKPVKPQDRLTVTVNSMPQDIFMSGGLIRQIVATIGGGVEDINTFFTNPFIQNDIVVEAVRPRNKRGQTKLNDDKPYTIDDFEITQEDFDTILNWAMEHVLYFFMSSLTNAQALSEKTQPLMEKMEKLVEQLPTGSQNSVA